MWKANIIQVDLPCLQGKEQFTAIAEWKEWELKCLWFDKHNSGREQGRKISIFLLKGKQKVMSLIKFHTGIIFNIIESH